MSDKYIKPSELPVLENLEGAVIAPVVKNGVTYKVAILQLKGERGFSSYELAVQNGYEGSEVEWIQSLKGDKFVFEDFTPEQIQSLKIKGDKGLSAYEVAVQNGFVGNESEWLNSLNGTTYYQYIAYASNNAGANFSLTPTDSLKYKAELVTTVQLNPPTLADFAGVAWVKYIGDVTSADLESLKMYSYSRNMYGCEFLKGSSDPNSIRWIGDEKFKTNHYILNQFKVAKVKDGAVVKFLNQTNWLKNEDGTASNIIIDGTVITDDGSDIMLVNTKGFYVINGGKNATYERRLVSDSPFTYDGEESQYVAPFGMCVDFSIVKDSKQRSIRDNSHTGTGGAGIGGLSYLSNGKGCPSASISRFNYELYARNKNVDNTKNKPYANNFTFDLNVWTTLMFIKFQTKDLHSTNLCGKCISSNDSAPTAGTWETMTGIRVTESDLTYSYYNFSSSRFRANSGGANTDFYNLINGYRPLLKMFEMQLALSYAKENSIAQNVKFNYDGSTYLYVNITGQNGIGQGEMTAKVRKFVSFQFTGYDGLKNQDVVNMPIDYVLEQAIINGKIAGWGNIWAWYSGVDMIVDANNANQYTIYQTDDVTKLAIDTDVTEKNPGEKFAFENVYDLIGTKANGSNYNLQLFDKSVMGKTSGASLHTGECTYSYYTGTASAGKIARRGVYFGGAAHYGSCALRYGYATYAPTATYTSIAGGFRVTLT